MPSTHPTLRQIAADMLSLLAVRALHLLERPAMSVDRQKAAAFDSTLAAAVNSPAKSVSYALPYPKYEFLRYVSEHHGLLLHGSNGLPRSQLEPRLQTTFFGQPATAVFATPDDIWSIFFAIVNNDGFVGSKRNGCIRIGLENSVRKFYWFSLSTAMRDREGELCEGTVHLLPTSAFRRSDIPDEWKSDVPVVPIAALRVAPADFPFEIGAHPEVPAWRFFWRMALQRRRPTH